MQQESVSLQSSGTWSNASQRLQWSQSAQQSPPTKTAAAKSAWGGGSAETQKVRELPNEQLSSSKLFLPLIVNNGSFKAATSSPLWDSPPLQAANKVAANPAKKPAAEKSSKSTKNGSNTIANEKVIGSVEFPKDVFRSLSNAYRFPWTLLVLESCFYIVELQVFFPYRGEVASC